MDDGGRCRPRYAGVVGGDLVDVLEEAFATAEQDGDDRETDLVDEPSAQEPAYGRHATADAAGETAAARSAYRDAARSTTSLPERRYLETRMSRLAVDRPGGSEGPRRLPRSPGPERYP